MAASRTDPSPSPLPIRALIFDMDGLLINTEEILTTIHNQILAQHSAGPLTWPIKAQLQGLTIREAIALVLSWANVTSVVTIEEYMAKMHALQEIKFPTAKPLPGVEKLLADLSTAMSGQSGRKIHLGLATSSDRHRFELKTRHLEGLFQYFKDERRVLGDDRRIPKGRGKPWPDIYLLALEGINGGLGEEEEPVRPEECLVLEDAVLGVLAGRRAGMRVLWVPSEGVAGEYRGREGSVLAGLREGDEDEGRTIGDGFGEQAVNLVRFPYNRYGIALTWKNGEVK